MKIAIASQNHQSVTPHAGKCRHFFIVDTEEGGPRKSVELGLSQILRIWPGEGPHPLDGVDVLIAGSIGVGVVEKLAQRGIRALATSECDLDQLVLRFLAGSLPVEATRTEANARSRPGTCLSPRS